MRPWWTVLSRGHNTTRLCGLRSEIARDVDAPLRSASRRASPLKGESIIVSGERRAVESPSFFGVVACRMAACSSSTNESAAVAAFLGGRALRASVRMKTKRRRALAKKKKTKSYRIATAAAPASELIVPWPACETMAMPPPVMGLSSFGISRRRSHASFALAMCKAG